MRALPLSTLTEIEVLGLQIRFRKSLVRFAKWLVATRSLLRDAAVRPHIEASSDYLKDYHFAEGEENLHYVGTSPALPSEKISVSLDTATLDKTAALRFAALVNNAFFDWCLRSLPCIEEQNDLGHSFSLFCVQWERVILLSHPGENQVSLSITQHREIYRVQFDFSVLPSTVTRHRHLDEASHRSIVRLCVAEGALDLAAYKDMFRRLTAIMHHRARITVYPEDLRTTQDQEILASLSQDATFSNVDIRTMD